MSLAPRQIIFHDFTEASPLDELGDQLWAKYIRRYLNDLGCRVVVEEPIYFDRDYLAEFAAFYCKSTRGYPNRCRRLHFFSEAALDRDLLLRAAGEDEDAHAALQGSYLGFAVVRPFEPPMLGRTVLCWYPETSDRPGRRVTTPSRAYTVHLAGVRLSVEGLAWQPQDSAVGACATIALWSMLHSSAFDDHHAIPTTAEITQAAHETASLGSRVFPSSGLDTYQILEAIKAQHLSPIVMEGDIEDIDKPENAPGFSADRFRASCAAFIRSGYPVLLLGMLEGVGRHSVCATGFREPSPRRLDARGKVELHDSDIEFIYVHDDNLGPGVRCRLIEGKDHGEIILRPEAPLPGEGSDELPDPSAGYSDFQPMSLVVAGHEDLMITPDGLHKVGLRIALGFRDTFLDGPDGSEALDISLQTRFIGLRDYMTEELRERVRDGEKLGRLRLALAERAAPMSLHLGLVQLSLGELVILQVLYDTTDNERFRRAFAHVCFEPGIANLARTVSRGRHLDLGVSIEVD